MKSIIIILLIGSSLCLFSSLIISKNHFLKDNDISIRNYEFNTTEYNNSIKHSQYTILIFTTNYCSSCNFALERIKKLKDVSIIKLPGNAFNNILLGESLSVRGFPTSFLVYNKYHIIGKIEGAKNLAYKVDSLIRVGKSQNKDRNNVSYLKILESFLNGQYLETKSVVSNKNINDMSVFDYYLMYRIQKLLKQDDSLFYKEKILDKKTKANFHIYNHIFSEINF